MKEVLKRGYFKVYNGDTLVSKRKATPEEILKYRNPPKVLEQPLLDLEQEAILDEEY